MAVEGEILGRHVSVLLTEVNQFTWSLNAYKEQCLFASELDAFHELDGIVHGTPEVEEMPNRRIDSKVPESRDIPRYPVNFSGRNPLTFPHGPANFIIISHSLLVTKGKRHYYS
jgi:hypothetical protein